MTNLKRYGNKLYEYIVTVQQLVVIDPATLHHLPDLQNSYNQLMNATSDQHVSQLLCKQLLIIDFLVINTK